MSQQDSEFWAKARSAQEKLVNHFIHHPEVSLIDIGYPPESDERNKEVVLRIHVREGWFKARPEERVTFPEEVDGIRVIIMPGEYYLQ